MDELSETELSIMAYIDSHVAEECMLDKISRGTSRSRATVLKYLDQLNAKGLISYRFVGRNKLWMPGHKADKAFSGAAGVADPAERPETRALLSKAAELYALKARELSLRSSIDSPGMFVFSTSIGLDIVASNETFETIFGHATSLRDIVRHDRAAGLYGRLASLAPGTDASIDVELMEKSGAYRPYHLILSAIADGSGAMTGISVAGETLSGHDRTKRELESLLYIIRVAGAAPDEKRLLADTLKSVKDSLLPYGHCAVFTREGETPKCAYQTFGPEGNFHVPGRLLNFISECMGRKETVAVKSGDFTLESLKADLGLPRTRLFIGIPLLDGESAIGTIVMSFEADTVSAASLEDAGIVADELASGLRMHRLHRERNEYASTLLAMNRISGIINGQADEEAVLERCIASTMETLGFEMGCVYLQDAGEELVLRVHRNLPEGLRSMCISGMFKDLFSKAFGMNMPVYITADSTDYASLDPAIRANGVKTLLILPVKSGTKIIGLLNMGSREIKAYDPVSLENLGSIGLQLGVALERTRLALQLKGDQTS